MKSVLLMAPLCFLLLATVTASPGDKGLPPVMREIFEQHPSFTVFDSTGTEVVSNTYYIGAASWQDRGKRSYWLNLNEKNHLEIYDCTRPENIVMLPMPLTGEPAIDIRTYYNFAYVLLPGKVLVLGLNGWPEANILGEVRLENTGKPVNLWVENDRLFVLSKNANYRGQSQIAIYSLEHPVKIKSMQRISVEMNQPQFFYVQGKRAFIWGPDNQIQQWQLTD